MGSYRKFYGQLGGCRETTLTTLTTLVAFGAYLLAERFGFRGRVVYFFGPGNNDAAAAALVEDLGAQRSALLGLRRDGVISDDVFEKLAAEVDGALFDPDRSLFIHGDPTNEYDAED